jgi:hypothetical protein
MSVVGCSTPSHFICIVIPPVLQLLVFVTSIKVFSVEGCRFTPLLSACLASDKNSYIHLLSTDVNTQLQQIMLQVYEHCVLAMYYSRVVVSKYDCECEKETFLRNV